MTNTLLNTSLKGSVSAIPSKSHVHRLLIAAALYGRQSEIICEGIFSADITATIKCLQALNADISTEGSTIYVKGKRCTTDSDLAYSSESTADLYCGESGSTMRFMLPVVCALGANSAFHPEGRLPQRPLSPLREELISHGCHVDEVGTLPFKTSGKLQGGIFEIAGNVSSQYITGLLFALPLLEEKSEIHIVGKLESRPYVDMTLEVLSHFGVNITVESDSLILIGGKSANTEPAENLTFYADGDWSNAAFWLTAGAVGSGEICVSGLRTDSKQGDKAVLELLKKFGARATVEKNERGLEDITVFPSELHAIDIDASDIPDLVPILSLAAACAEGTTNIYNAQRLRLKESDRLETVSKIFDTLGAEIHETDDGLIIKGRKNYGGSNSKKYPLKGGTVDSFNDHRIAMTAAIAATVCQNEVTITGAEAVNKSYPLFWQDYNKLNNNLNRK